MKATLSSKPARYGPMPAAGRKSLPSGEVDRVGDRMRRAVHERDVDHPRMVTARGDGGEGGNGRRTPFRHVGEVDVVGLAVLHEGDNRVRGEGGREAGLLDGP